MIPPNFQFHFHPIHQMPIIDIEATVTPGHFIGDDVPPTEVTSSLTQSMVPTPTGSQPPEVK